MTLIGPPCPTGDGICLLLPTLTPGSSHIVAVNGVLVAAEQLTGTDRVTATATLSHPRTTYYPSQDPQVYEHRVDAEAPTVTIAASMANALRPGCSTLTGSAEDGAGSGVATVEVVTDSIVAATGTLVWSTHVCVPTDSNTFDVTLNAKDAVGNVGTLQHTFDVDAVAPTIAFDVPGVLGGRYVALWGTAVDPSPPPMSRVSKVEVQIDGEGTPWLPVSGPFEPDEEDEAGKQPWVFHWALPHEDGVGHELRARAIDVAGNVAVGETLVSTVDSVSPVITVTHALAEGLLSAYVAGREGADPEPIVVGEVSDGYGLATEGGVQARIYTPMGTTVIAPADVADGEFTLTPAFAQPRSGDYHIRIEATDLGGNTTVDGPYVFTALNSPPVAEADLATTDEDMTATLDVLDNDIDADGDALIISGVTQPQHGTVSVVPQDPPEHDVLSYVPEADFNGQDTLSCIVSDGMEESLPATVAITVHPINDPPVVSAMAPVVLDEGHSVTIALDTIVDDLETPDDAISWAADVGEGVLAHDSSMDRADLCGGIAPDALSSMAARAFLPLVINMRAAPVSATLAADRATDRPCIVAASGAVSVVIDPAARTATIHGLDGPHQATVTLTATDRGDPDGCTGEPPDCSPPASASVDVDATVNNVAPLVSAGDDRYAFEHGPVALDPTTFTDLGGPDTHTATVDWGDGTVVVGDVDQAADTVDGTHVFTTPGTYTVQVAVTDNDGDSGSDSFTVTVLHGFFSACVSAGKAGDDLDLEEDASALCSVYGAGKVQVKKNATVTGDVVARTKEASIEEAANIGGSVASDSKIDLKKDALVGGDVTSGDDVKLEGGSRVAGDVTAAGKVDLKSGATVGGTILEHANVPALPSITAVTVNLSADGTNVTVKKNETTTLPAGTYGRLKVEEYGTLRLGAGTYGFNSIDAHKNATIQINLAGGAVTMDVEKQIDLKEGVVMTVAAGDAGDVLLRIAGSNVKLGKGGRFLGTFVAPDAHIDVGEGATVTGALHGRKVQLKKGASIIPAPAMDLFAELFVR